ncbi:hypothetical protein C1646_773843 [Rhizophagus diaphanus]|nr:hypothetical protein C1646_773843 [Rhizophagus diaphanus] [Rhizophagus sp. MUCL 43196]
MEVRGWIFLEPREAKTMIAHAIKRYVRVGCDLVDGTNIETALQDLSGTSVAHIEPNRDQLLGNEKQNEKRTKTIPARPLSNIGTWTEFSPTQVASFCGVSYRLSPTISDPTIPKSSWVMPIPDEKKGSIRIIVLIKDNYNKEKNVKYWTRNPITNNNESDIGGNYYFVDPEFPFDAGWALKENLQLGNKGEGKRMSKKVVQYLQGYFLVGNLRPADCYSSEAMHASLENLVTEGELVLKEIPTIKTIKGWIGRYSKSFKKEASECALIETNAS